MAGRTRPRCECCNEFMYGIESRLPPPGEGNTIPMAKCSRKRVGWICRNGCTIKSELSWVPPATPP